MSSKYSCLAFAAIFCSLGMAEVAVRRAEFVTTSGDVTSMSVAGDTLYVAGQFGTVGPASGGFAAVGASDALLVPGTARVSGQVNACVADGQGGWFIGGEFTLIDGIERRNLAHIRADGKLDTGWDCAVSGDVYALALSGDSLYVGGSLYRLGGLRRDDFGVVDAASGAVLP